VKAEEVAARYANMQAWYTARHHFWIGTGPYFVDSVFPVEGTIVLKHFADYPDPADKWNRFSAPKIAVADVSGPAQVTIGEEAVFDVFISFQDAPYPQNELSSVAFMVYDSAGKLIESALAEYVEDGHYQAVLPASVTNKLIAGASKIEFVVSPSVVSIPTFSAREFLVVAP
jgi:peptide/nickel transport system substrate-binding protein